jgi:hypothetical protein
MIRFRIKAFRVLAIDFISRGFGFAVKDIFENRKTDLLNEKKDIEEKLNTLKDEKRSAPELLAEFFELTKRLYLDYEMGYPEEKREWLNIVTSNREVDGKYVDIKLSLPFRDAANYSKNSYGAPQRDRLRTLDKMIVSLLDWFSKNPKSFIRPL